MNGNTNAVCIFKQRPWSEATFVRRRMAELRGRWMWFYLLPLLGYACLVMVQLPLRRDCIRMTSDNHHATMSGSTHSSATDVDVGGSNDAPQVEALFLIRFDKKVGCVGRVPPWRTQC